MVYVSMVSDVQMCVQMEGRSAQADSVPTSRRDSTLRLGAVGIDPHAKRHVWVHDEIQDGTT